MNRILFEASELEGDLLHLQDRRERHVRKVLRSQVGDRLRCGQINGALAAGELVAWNEGQLSLRIEMGELPPRPRTDLLLAMPRPKQLRRLLPQLSALGLRKIYLAKTARVERYYFDSHVMEEGKQRELLLEGLEQAGDTWLPEVERVWNLERWLEQLGDEPARRWMLDPSGDRFFGEADAGGEAVLMAIGAEGGWIASELDQLRTAGFQSWHLGRRILRTDTACCVALGMLLD